VHLSGNIKKRVYGNGKIGYTRKPGDRLLIEYLNDRTYRALQYFTRAEQEDYNRTLDALRINAPPPPFTIDPMTDNPYYCYDHPRGPNGTIVV
jgi:hypothetical protein